MRRYHRQAQLLETMVEQPEGRLDLPTGLAEVGAHWPTGLVEGQASVHMGQLPDAFGWAD